MSLDKPYFSLIELVSWHAHGVSRVTVLQIRHYSEALCRVMDVDQLLIIIIIRGTVCELCFALSVILNGKVEIE